MRSVTLVVLVLVAAVPAFGKSFRYREFVPTSVDCPAEVAALSARFTQQTGAVVTSTNCAPVTIQAPDDQDTFAANAATLIYSSAHEFVPNTVEFGRGLAYGSVGLAGNIGGSYDHQASCQADLARQSDLFTQQTGATPIAAFCEPPETGGIRFNLRIDSFQRLAKRLFFFDSLHDAGTDADRKSIQDLVAQQGVAVALANEDRVFFYDVTGSNKGEATPARMKLRSASAGMFNTGDECLVQKSALDSILQRAGLSGSLIACTGEAGVSSLELVSPVADRLFFNGYGRSAYASLAECNADADRLSKEAAGQSKSFIGGFCSYQDPLNASTAYGLEAIYLNR